MPTSKPAPENRANEFKVLNERRAPAWRNPKHMPMRGWRLPGLTPFARYLLSLRDFGLLPGISFYCPLLGDGLCGPEAFISTTQGCRRLHFVAVDSLPDKSGQTTPGHYLSPLRGGSRAVGRIGPWMR